MKTLKITLLLLVILAAQARAQEKSAEQRIIEGIYQEEVTGDLDKAEKIYLDVLKNCGGERVICARALYHLGLVAEMKAEGRGQKAEGKDLSKEEGRIKGAEAYYVQIIEKYPEVGDYAGLARGRLAKLKDANTFVDPRDGHKYRWVKIGNQVWMAENLAYMPWVNPPKKQEFGIWVYDYEGYDVAEAKATENYQKYGCLYDWPTAMAIGPEYLEKEWGGDPENHQGLCPPGWRLPSKMDWIELGKSVGGDSALLYDDVTDGEIKGASKMKSTDGWLSGGNGDNQTKLNIRPGGIVVYNKYRFGRDFQELGLGSYFWSSTQPDQEGVNKYFNNRFLNAQYYPAFGFWFTGLGRYEPSDLLSWIVFESSQGFSIRCIKSEGFGNKQGDSALASFTEHKPSSAKIQNISYSDIKINQVHFIPRPEQKRVRGFMHLYKGVLIDWSPSDSVLQAFDLNDFSSKWQIKTLVVNGRNDGTSGLSINNDTIAFNDGQKICFVDIKNGEELRSIASEKGQLMNFNVSDKLIVRTGLRTSKFLCLNKITGQKVWEYSLGDSVFFSPPINFGDTIVFNTYDRDRAESGRKGVVALNINTGDEYWSYDKRGNSDYKSPIKIDNQLVFNSFINQYLYSIDAKTGEKNWGYFLTSGMTSNIITDGNSIFFKNYGMNGEIPVVTALGKDGNEKWCKKLPDSQSPKIFSWDGKLFIPSYVQNDSYEIIKSEVVVVSQSTTGKNWKITLPPLQILDILFDVGRMIIRTAEGIYVYKYPDFE